MAKGKRLLVVEHSPDLGAMVEAILQEEGYNTASAPADSGAVRIIQVAKRVSPDTILVDLVPGHDHDFEVLDLLRTDPSTRATPVVAMSTTPSVLEQSVTSYNVRQMLLKPFEVEDLLEKTRAAIEQTPVLALMEKPIHPISPLFAEVAAGLTAASPAMIVRWAQRLTADEPYRSRELDLVASVDHIPILLQVVLLALQSEDFTTVLEHRAVMRGEIAQHVRLRRQQGISLSNLVKEYEYMGEEILCELLAVLKNKAVSSEDMLGIITREDRALGEALRLAIEQYQQQERENT